MQATAMVAIAAFTSAPLLAQDTGATPNYGNIQLNSGFTPDPYSLNVQAGGSVPASNAGNGCAGNISNAPDLRVNFRAGSRPLIIGVESNSDTTLVVNAPDGRWYCDDDRGSGTNPLVRFNEVQSGRYEIWVGTYGSTDLRPATLYITELENVLGDDLAVSQEPVYDYPDASRNPTYTTMNLRSGFTPDPRTVRLRAGGRAAASSALSGCSGYVAVAPDVRVEYSAGSLPLIISADSGSDTTLLVNDPNGNWYCDDDSGEGVNPSLRFDKPASGTYDVWVGVFSSSGELQDATLHVSELYSQ